MKKIFFVILFLTFVSISGLVLKIRAADSNLIPSIFIKTEKGDKYTGGVITMSSSEKPVVQVGSYDKSGEAKVAVYEASENILLDYLVHDEMTNQANKHPDASKLKFLANDKLQIKSGYDNAADFILPVETGGIYLLRIEYGDRTDDYMIVISQTGVVLKEGRSEFLFWAQDLKSGKKKTGGQIKIYSLLNRKQQIGSSDFDADGIAKTAYSSEADIGLAYFNNEIIFIPINLRYLNSDYANTPEFSAQELQKTKYFIFTDRPLYRPDDNVFFKAILRDNDDYAYFISQGTVLVKCYRDWDEKNTIFEKEMTLNADGSVYGEINLPEDTKTGFYQIKVLLKDLSNQWVWDNVASFQVEFFRKPEYFLTIKANDEKLIAQDKTKFTIKAQYFSGQPVIGQTINYSLYANDYYSFEYESQRRALLSDDYRYGYWAYEKIKSGETLLDEKGEAVVEINTKEIKKFTKNQVLSIEAELDIGSGNPAFARKNILVFAGEFDFFRKDYRSSFNVKEKLGIPVVIVSSGGEKIKSQPFTVSVKREEWVKTQKKDQKYPSWEKKEEFLPSLNAVTDNKGEATIIFTPIKNGYYYFTARAKDKRGNTIEKTFSIWVNDTDNYYFGSDWVNQVRIEADKKNYQVGDKQVLTILSEKENQNVLVTIEREWVHQYKVISLTGKSGTWEIKSDESFLPNIFASASSFSTDRFNRATTNLSFSTDNKKLSVNLKTDKVKYSAGDSVRIDIETKDNSGNPVAADLAVWAVDKAIFELIDQQPASVFDAFWSARYDNTRMRNSFENVNIFDSGGRGGCFSGGTKILMENKKLSEIQSIKTGDVILTRENENSTKLVKGKVLNIVKHEVPGLFIINKTIETTPEHRFFVNGRWLDAGKIKIGDMLENYQGQKITVSSLEWMLGKAAVYNLEIEKYHTFIADGIYVHNQKGGGGRSVFKDTAYWNPSVKTDTSGRAQLVFKLPDNLTTWVISGIGATTDTVAGDVKTEIVVTKNVIVRPLVPNIIRVGDKIKVGVLVENFSDNDEVFNVALEYDGGKIINNPVQKKLILKDMGQTFYWSIEPKKTDEKTQFIFKAESEKNKKIADKIRVNIKTLNFGYYEKTVQTGIGENSIPVKLNPKADEKNLKAKLHLSSSLIGNLPEAMEYLVRYPYGCVEQTTSRFVPAIIAKINPNLYGKVYEQKDVDAMIEKGISKLTAAQGGDGGWAWWGSQESDIYVSAYVIEYLDVARQNGFKIDENVFNKAKTFFEKEGGTEEEKALKIYGLSFLDSKLGKVKIENFNNFSSDVLAISVLTNIKNGYVDLKTNGTDKLVSISIKSGDEIFWNSGQKSHFGSNDASTAIALRAIIKAKVDRDIIIKAAKYLTRNRKSIYWSNTFATAQVVVALTEFEKIQDELKPSYSYQVLIDNEKVFEGQFNKTNDSIDYDIPDKKIKNNSVVEIKKQGQGELYTTFELSELFSDKKAQAKNEGLKIIREYVFPKNEYTPAVGDVVTIKLTLKGRASEDLYGVIVDYLPSGLIPINERFKNQQYQNTNNNYYENWGHMVNREYTENGAIMGLYKIEQYERTYTYQARVVSPGEFYVPPATVELMYSPTIKGRSGVNFVKLTEKPEIIPEQMLKKNVQKYKKTINDIASIVVLSLIIFVIIFLIIKLERIIKKRLNHL